MLKNIQTVGMSKQPRISAPLVKVWAMATVCLFLMFSAKPSIAQGSSMVMVGQENWIFPGWGSLTEVKKDGISKNTKLISELNQSLDRKNIKLLVLLLPDKARMYAEKLPDNVKLSEAVNKRYTDVLQALTQSDVLTFDDVSVLANVKAQGKQTYYRTDQHWTLAASDATALATAETIQNAVGQLAGKSGTGVELGDQITERRYGDLAELFLSPKQRKEVGREIYTVRRPHESQGLIDEQAAPVHVSGNSMVQPYFGYPDMLSNALDRPVSLNWKPGNVGHWQVLLDYLESPMYRNQKPQVLVWQIFEATYELGPDAKGWWDNASIMSADTWLSRVKSAVAQ